MSPLEAVNALYNGCREDKSKERLIALQGLVSLRKDLRKANKARGILEACLRDIHTTDPGHKSAIECAWVAIQRLDEE